MGSSPQKSTDEALHSAGKNKSRGWRIGPKLKRLHIKNKPTTKISKHTICFQLSFPYLTDDKLQFLLNDEYEFEIAKVVRDLKVVLSHHLGKSHFLTKLMAVQGDFTNAVNDESIVNLDDNIDDIMNKLLSLKRQLHQASGRTVASSDARAENQNEKHQTDEEQLANDCKKTIHNHDFHNFLQQIHAEGPAEDTSTNRNGHSNDYPTPEQYSHLPWPACVGITGFLSILCSTCAAFNPPMWKHQLEMADFCIAPFNYKKEHNLEPMYKDGWIRANLNRSDFCTFEANRILAAPVLSAWGRLLNNIWAISNHPSACLNIYNLDDEDIQPDQMLEIWHCWLVACKVDFLAAELVFIPFRQNDCYGLLIVNFKEGKFQQIHCCRKEPCEDGLDRIALDIGNYFWKFLLRIGDSRYAAVQEFDYEVITPHWCFATNNQDSGIVTMHVMEVYSGVKYELIHVPLHQVNFRLRKRVSICTRIAASKLNLLRPKIMEGIASNIRHKVDKYET